MFVPGQRWISSAEPELGLGTVLRVEGRHIQVLFAKAGVLRPYAIESAPLVRAEFRAGQRIAGKGISFLVERVEVKEDLLVYRGEGRELHEGQLDDEQSISQADDRLMSGRTDSVAQFELRQEGLQRRAQARRSPAWGLHAARIGLIPHQLRVAGIAASRRPPRVLLADEVGLGKTIEAGMIIARQYASGRAQRVLVLVPEALISQWFIELRRRFNLSFAIYDEERCEALEQSSPDSNPFEDESLILVNISLLEREPSRTQQLIDASWDLLIVDEAHHLEWTPEHSSPRYLLVEQLARSTPGLILLTATPEQLGRGGHFARLRLLDPQRYHDFNSYLNETADYPLLSQLANRLLKQQPLDSAQLDLLQQKLAGDAELAEALQNPSYAQNAHSLLMALIDQHGTGRIMFRHRRDTVGGFPARQPLFHYLETTAFHEEQRQALLAEFQADIQQTPATIELKYQDDPRVNTLVALLEQYPQEKFLLICRSQTKVLALEEALRTKSGIGIARFHEGLGLLQRDRNAAFFAQADGARLLLCSEIGSEGRNFQFAHHLVLWDLPIDPDLVEQRIGRLDRIGQHHPIIIHMILLADSAQHVLARWYDEGLNAFHYSPADSRALLDRFGPLLTQLAENYARDASKYDQELATLLAETRSAYDQQARLIQAGRDHLLELAAKRDSHADELELALALNDHDPKRDAFIQRLLEQFGIHTEEISTDILILDPQYLSTEALPGFADGPIAVTFNRQIALAREDLPLLRLDHPLVVSALDLLLSNEQGNATFMIDDHLPARTALLQTVYVLECVAHCTLDIERFLPPQPLTITVDTRLAECKDFEPSQSALQKAANRHIDVARYRKFLNKLVPPMLEKTRELANNHARTHIDEAINEANTTLTNELARLQALRAINPSIQKQELSALSQERMQLQESLAQAHLRLDSVRFVVSPDFLALR